MSTHDLPCSNPRCSLVPWILLLGLLGCASPPPAPECPGRPLSPFSAGGQHAVADRWWTAFGDPALDYHVNQALGDSFTLGAALHRLRASRALVRREASDLFADVDGFLTTDGTFGSGRNQSAVAWGFDASYQIDLWGQIQSRVEAERLRAEATHADYHAVAITLAAEIAGTWFALIEAHAQLELLDEQIETNEIGLKSQELRFGRGFVRSADVLRQRQLVEATREQAVVERARIEVLEHQLAVLLGQLPQAASYDPGAELPELPPIPDTGLPSELLMRRPDVRRDFLAFRAADRDLAAAVSDQYPRINLTGSLVNAAENPGNLFRHWFVSIGSQLIAPLLDGGQRRAEVDRNVAVVRLRFNEYQQTMLNAFREVEDSLALERRQIQRIERLQSQVGLAQQASDQLFKQYLIGDADYLDVLSAIQSQQRLQRETLSARLELLLIRVGLYVALAGDFSTRPFVFEEDSPDPTEFPSDTSELPPGFEVIPSPEELPPQIDIDE